MFSLSNVAQTLRLSNMNSTTKSVLTFGSVIFATVFTHWALIQLYVTACAPWSLWGPAYALIALGSPFCHFINVIQLEIAKHYIVIWVAAAGAIVVWLTNKIKFKND